MERYMSRELVEEYAAKIEPILPLAKKAYGRRNQDTAEHKASQQYTELLKEFQNRGGSLPLLAKRINVAYAGVRRRVAMSNIAVSDVKPKIRLKEQNIEAAAERVRSAKEKGTNEYHDQLRSEYMSGISLSNLAKFMGLSSAAPLYYGVQRSLQRHTN
jgi:hypothetical protein